LVKAGDFARAAPVLTQYLAKHPDSTEGLELRAYSYVKLGRPADVLNDCKRAAPLGDAYCEYMLGVAYTFGLNGFPTDPDAAVRWLRPAAAQGQARAGQLLAIAIAKQRAQPHPPGTTRSPIS
jgi:TPR repeat protein